jgi:hypothetical protein
VTPDALRSRYPNLSLALLAMRDRASVKDAVEPHVREAARAEVATFVQANEPVILLVDWLFPETPTSRQALMAFSMAGYPCLGASDATRQFLASVWVACLSQWDDHTRGSFLLSTADDAHDVFQALDYLALVLPHATFDASQTFAWIVAASQRVSKDLVQRGFTACVHAVCARSPAVAVDVAERWLNSDPDERALATIGMMTSFVRLRLWDQPEEVSFFSDFDCRLSGSALAARRAVYLRSWSSVAASLDEATAFEVRGRVSLQSDEELGAWCFLLTCIANISPTAGGWVCNELRRIATGDLGAEPRHWAMLTALNAIRSDVERNRGLLPETLGLFSALLPMPQSSRGTWSAIQDILVDCARQDAPSLLLLVQHLARYSGESWLEAMKSDQFDWFTQVLVDTDLGATVAADLCFTDGVSSRRLGLYLFEHCQVGSLDAAVLAAAPALEVELVLLEARRVVLDSSALARLHRSLAARAEEDVSLRAALYDEIGVQALNSYRYCETLRNAAPQHHGIRDALTQVESRLRALESAAQSPALQMEVPGQRRAEELFIRKMARDVGAGVRERSVFLKHARNIRLLYGDGRHRLFDPLRGLSESSELHTTSADLAARGERHFGAAA